MAVTPNSLGSGVQNGGSSLSFTVTILAGLNLGALIGISWAIVTDVASIQSVTVDGVPATFIQTVQDATDNVSQYYIVGLTAGVRTVLITWDAQVYASAGIVVMNNVVQASPVGGHNTAKLTGTTAQVITSTTDAAGMVVDTLAVNRPTNTNATKDVSQTQEWNAAAGIIPISLVGAASLKAGAIDTVTMKWTLSRSQAWLLAAVEFKFQPPVTVSLGGYTSYDYVNDPTPLESVRDPAVTQRIWANDRRFMQGV